MWSMYMQTTLKRVSLKMSTPRISSPCISLVPRAEEEEKGLGLGSGNEATPCILALFPA